MYIKLISAQKTPIRKKKCDKKAYRGSKDSKQLLVSITPPCQWGGLYWYAFHWIGRTLNNNEKNTWVRWNNMKKKKTYVYCCLGPLSVPPSSSRKKKKENKQTNPGHKTCWSWGRVVLWGPVWYLGGHHKLPLRLGFLCMVVALPLSVPIHVV